MLLINLGKKLISDNLADIVTKYWEASLQESSVTFQLDELEWIANSEISFLISWIRCLEDNQTKITITFQSSRELYPDSLVFQKRKYCFERLVIQWRLLEHISKKTTLINRGITSDKMIDPGFSNFSAIPVGEYKTESFDQDFHTIYNSYLTSYSNNLKAALKKTSISFYDQMFLDYSIIKELYSNTSLHGFPNNSDECYFSIGVIRKFRGNSDKIGASRVSELSELERSFFTTGGNYRNIDFIEINFHDFGHGIANSLRRKYKEEKISDLKEFFGERYDLHANQSEDARIIDYALLLFTSQYEIDRKIEIHDFIPRGLFILKDIAKKYEGYLEVISNGGGIAMGFKDDVDEVAYLKLPDNQTAFPGTRIKIILPAIENEVQSEDKVKVASINQEESAAFQHLSFLELYAEVENEIVKNVSKVYNLNKRNQVTCALFSYILDYFKKIPKHYIVLIDFAGIEPKTADFFNKFIYFISHFPISGSSKLVLCNLATKGLNSTIIFNSANALKSQGYYPYPIPCVNIDLSVEWLGVKEDSYAENFTQLWIGDTREEYMIANISNYTNKLIGIKRIDDKYHITIHLPSLKTVLSAISGFIKSQIEKELNNNGIRFYTLTDGNKDYNKIVNTKEDTVFLTSNGKFINEYISFNEKLYIPPYRRMIAGYFVMKLHEQIEELSAKERPDKIGKILSVTLSSQLIGKEVKELLSAIYQKNVELVALSNYYNFQNEEKFNDIKQWDRILIVNDVISTGNLTQNIIKSIEIKGAVPYSCLSIVDLRKDGGDYGDVPVISLAHYTVSAEEIAPAGKHISVINPVLNVPTAIPRARSMENVLLSKDEFLAIVDEKYWLVGNMRNNAVYFNYFLQTYELLKDDSKKDFPFLRFLLERLKQKKQQSNLTDLQFLIKGLDIVGKNITDEPISTAISQVHDRLSMIKHQMSPDVFDDYQVDVVFYPFLSDISVLESDSTPFLQTSLSPNAPMVYPIPRIMTSRGWRFSFPPKFLQLLIREHKMAALILDDGSLTGDTLMQMIDSISFLSVKSIDVFSIFGRLEDFQKELFSRIKSVQVKDAVAPVNVYFGVHFNIPVYNIIESPEQTELRELTKVEEKLARDNIRLSDKFQEFLSQQRTVLEAAKFPVIDQPNPNLFNGISKREMFKIRDFLGRYDSYRLYSDDLQKDYEDVLIGNPRAILTLLTVLNMEPQLYQNLKRLLSPEKRLQIISVIEVGFIENTSLTDEGWKLEFFTKALFYLNPNEFFKEVNLIRLASKLFEKASLFEHHAFRYLEYLIILVILKIKSADDGLAFFDVQNNIDSFLLSLKRYEANIFSELRFASDVCRLIRASEISGYNLPINKYHELRKYYRHATTQEGRHDEQLRTNLFADVTKQSSTLRHILQSNHLNKDIDKQNVNLTNSILQLRSDFKKYPEFGYISDIVKDLHRYGSHKFDMNINEISKNCYAMIDILENFGPPYDLPKLALLDAVIQSYQVSVLVVNSDFVKFIVASKSNIITEWLACENEFIKNYPDAKPIDTSKCKDLEVNVNPYALWQAFEDMMLNKYQYAKDALWKMDTIEDDQFQEVYIVQNGKSIPSKGDGTGQHTIKAILANYGVFYTNNPNPYTVKLIFSKDN